MGHRDGYALGELFELNNFGGDLHTPSICAHAQLSSTGVCADAQRAEAYLRGIIGLMTKGATERETRYKNQVAIYLETVMFAKRWSQSDVARAVNVRSTTVNKALKRRHVMKYPTLLALEEAADVPIPPELATAAKALNAPAPRTPDMTEAESFFRASPEWQEMVRIGKKLQEATAPDQKRELKRELQRLLSKVS